MAQNDELDRLAKQYLSKATKKKPVDNVSAQPKKVATKAAPMSEPMEKAARAPKAKPNPLAAQSKNFSTMEPDVSIPQAKANAAKAPINTNPERHAELLEEMAPARAGFADVIEHDLPRGGSGALKVAEELAPTATSRAEMAAIKSGEGRLMGRLGKMVGGGMVGATLAGPVGFGLQALMEGLDAEEAGNPHEGHLSNFQDKAGAALADKAINRQAQSALKSGRLVPPQRHQDMAEGLYGEEGPTPQQKMEDAYAAELKKYPR